MERTQEEWTDQTVLDRRPMGRTRLPYYRYPARDLRWAHLNHTISEEDEDCWRRDSYYTLRGSAKWREKRDKLLQEDGDTCAGSRRKHERFRVPSLRVSEWNLPTRHRGCRQDVWGYEGEFAWTRSPWAQAFIELWSGKMFRRWSPWYSNCEGF